MHKELLEKIGVKSLSDMQKSAFRYISEGSGDVVILSPTGSGKTLAYLLPLIDMIENCGDRNLQAVVMLPSRELARQSYEYSRKLSRNVSTYACYGGRTAMFEHREIKGACPQIIFSTPGRLNDHIGKGNIDVSGVKWLVIDEFDKCLEFGFHDEMSSAFASMPSIVRRILLSATDADEIPDFVNMENVERIDFLEENNPLGSRINKFFLRSESADKLTSLGNLLCSFGRARSIVYAGFRESVERISSYLREEGFVVASLHGGLEQEERNEAVYLFLNKSANILVSTNLSSRGLDLPDVDNIIHYHLPETSGDYIHRSGRTARWEAEGNTYFILSPSEQLPDYVGDDVIECCLPESLPEVALPEFSTIYIGKGKQDKISRGDVLGFLCKKGGLSSKEIGRIDVYDRYSRAAVSREKMKTLLRRLEGEKIKGVKTKVEELKQII